MLLHGPFEVLYSGLLPMARTLQWSVPIKDTLGAGAFVLYSKAVLEWEVRITLVISIGVVYQCPLYKACPFVGGPVIGGSIVLTFTIIIVQV